MMALSKRASALWQTDLAATARASCEQSCRMAKLSIECDETLAALSWQRLTLDRAALHVHRLRGASRSARASRSACTGSPACPVLLAHRTSGSAPGASVEPFVVIRHDERQSLSFSLSMRSAQLAVSPLLEACCIADVAWSPVAARRLLVRHRDSDHAARAVVRCRMQLARRQLVRSD